MVHCDWFIYWTDKATQGGLKTPNKAHRAPKNYWLGDELEVSNKATELRARKVPRKAWATGDTIGVI
jgi:hypothetical protein